MLMIHVQNGTWGADANTGERENFDIQYLNIIIFLMWLSNLCDKDMQTDTDYLTVKQNLFQTERETLHVLVDK